MGRKREVRNPRLRQERALRPEMLLSRKKRVCHSFAHPPLTTWRRPGNRPLITSNHRVTSPVLGASLASGTTPAEWEWAWAYPVPLTCAKSALELFPTPLLATLLPAPGQLLLHGRRRCVGWVGEVGQERLPTPPSFPQPNLLYLARPSTTSPPFRLSPLSLSLLLSLNTPPHIIPSLISSNSPT
ncbi:hypothetical protein CGRA01v4_01071 [Colletotrichum graminicola]|nr:hypothetical protein CGRA01v4_01071 [Colletotrichum graminicola]